MARQTGAKQIITIYKTNAGWIFKKIVRDALLTTQVIIS